MDIAYRPVASRELRRDYPGNFGYFSSGCFAFHSLCDAEPSQILNDRGGRPRPLHVSWVCGSQYFGSIACWTAAPVHPFADIHAKDTSRARN